MEIVIRLTVPEGTTVVMDSNATTQSYEVHPAPFHPALEEAPWPVPVFQDNGVASQAPQSHAAPPVSTSQPSCPDHRQVMVWKPAGVSKRTGAAYNAFWACGTQGCKRTFNP